MGQGKSPTLLYDREASGWKAWLSIGTVEMKKNEVGLAMEAWRKGLELSPKNRILLKHLIAILLQVGGWLEAEEYLITLMGEYKDEQTDANKLCMANVYYNTDREIQGLELCWSLAGRKEYLDHLLSQLIADQRYDKVEQVDRFIKSKELIAEVV
jgi:hypothetical protein